MTLGSKDGPTLEETIRDLPIGVVGKSPGRTIGEGEFSILTSLCWITSESHTNKEYSRGTDAGERTLAGPIIISLIAGLWVHSKHYRTLRETHRLRITAGLGMEVKFLAPVLPGDTLWCECEIESARISNSKPGFGVITFVDRGVNQKGSVVMEMHRTCLFDNRFEVSGQG
jgi:acyl dehydratase